jgi:hypothetical protein
VKRSILGLIVGLAVWVLVASLLNRSLRFGLEGYAAVEPQMTFTYAMMAARLAVGALASLGGRGHKGCLAVEHACVVGARRSTARGVHPGTRSALDEVSGVVSPRVSGDSSTTCCSRRDVHSKPFAHSDERARQKRLVVIGHVG